MFRKALLLGASLALFSSASIAQVIPSPAGTMLTSPARFQSYSVSYTAITTTASLTDFLTITGSATRTIYIRNIECSGVSTAIGVGSISLIKRSTADTGGTTITPSATAGGQLVPLDSTNAAASATVAAYSANPTTGTLVGVLRTAKISTGLSGTGSAPLFSFLFSNDNQQALTLRGAAQQFALGGLGTALPAGTVLSCNITWIEGS